jgi:hypothetical protein
LPVIVASGGDGSTIAGGAAFERFCHELSHQSEGLPSRMGEALHIK